MRGGAPVDAGQSGAAGVPHRAAGKVQRAPSPGEESSDPELWAALRESAEAVGSGDAFPDQVQGVVEDDHTPFIERGVPSIDLIDFTFPCWHRRCDDLKAVSKASLDASGETVRELLGSWR
jgi:hypothetical protein